MLDKAKLVHLTAEVNSQHEIKIEDIPEMELYMEQLLQFLNQQLAHPGDSSEAVFSKTMINNYTKDGILIPSKNKRYSRQHIMLLALIHNLKGILTISDIKKLLAPVLRDVNTPDDDLLPLETVYKTYLEMSVVFLKEFNKVFFNQISFVKDITEKMEGEADAETAQRFLTILGLAAQANMNKSLAKILLDKYMPNEANTEKISYKNS